MDMILTSVSKIGTPTVPTLRTPERQLGAIVAPIVTSVRPYPSVITASGKRASNASPIARGMGAAPEVIPRTDDRSAVWKSGQASSAANRAGAPLIDV